MGYTRVLAVLVVSMFAAGLAAAPVQAAPSPPSSSPKQVSVTQELIVTATVTPKRRIVVDAAGRIVRIVSNTTEDVRPDVYTFDIAPRNATELTDGIYKEYRRLVPEGTGRAGILYDRTDPERSDVAISLLRPQAALIARR